MQEIITFKISKEIKKEILQRAKEEERNLSELCRLLIKNHLRDKNGKK
ncbi:MAG: hypothetical protein V1866_04185 [archaeon]